MHAHALSRSTHQCPSILPAVRCFAFLLMVGACATAHAAGGDLVWAGALTGNGTCHSFDMATDGAGNVYVLGAIGLSDIDLDPGPGVVARSSMYGSIFMLKLDSEGHYLWDKQWKIPICICNEIFPSLAVDIGGNVYLGGAFGATVDFDPGPGTAYLSPALPSTTEGSGFVVKLNSNGEFIWARCIGASVECFGNHVDRQLTLDPSGNVILIGTFTASADFDPGPGVAMLTYRAEPCHSNVFIVKLSPDGNLVWAKSLEGASTGRPGHIYGIDPRVTTDAEGSVILSVPHFDGFDVDPGPGVAMLPSLSEMGTAIVKLNAAGDFVWTRSLLGSYFDFCLDISARNGTDIVLTGLFSGTIDFDPGPGTALQTTAPTPDDNNMYLLKLDGSGNFSWVKTITGPGYSLARSVEIDESGNVYAGGAFRGDSQYLDGQLLPSGAIGWGQPFLLKVNSSGNLMWLDVFGSDCPGFLPDSIYTDLGPNNRVYVMKPFLEPADFDPGPGVVLLTTTTPHPHEVSSAVLAFDGSEDPDPVGVILSSSSAAPAEVSPIPVTVTFSAPVTGFEASDLLVSNGSVSNFAGSGATYTFDLVPVSAGLVTVNVEAGAAKDALGRNTLAAPTFQIAYTPLPPNADSDGDGMPDIWEILYGLNPHTTADAGSDSDGDGLTALQEYQCGGAPNTEDTDGDGYWDPVERRAGSGLGDAGSVPSAPERGDLDRNGKTDAADVQIVINAALGRPTPCPGNLTGSGEVDALDVQLVINYALGKAQ